ncbi:hypothetical protein LJR231_003269 [Phyllobacterium sp. LjRoot231]|uniref:hypothetical protein n=1 Tax=Phyllobacterium sp. LjRoot231 TaxID=3342289 RepID=UPI003ECE8E1C
MKRTRDYYDFEDKRIRSFLVKVCDYGVAVMLLTGIVYSTYLDMEARFKPSDIKVSTAPRPAAAIKSVIE